MEHPGGFSAIGSQGVEKRCVIAFLDTAKNIQVQLEIIILAVKNSPKGSRRAACYGFDGLIGDQEKIQFRAQLGQVITEQGSVANIRQLVVLDVGNGLEITLQNLQVVLRP